MPTLDSLLAAFGQIDRIVGEVGEGSPQVAAKVERLLPGTTGRHQGWFTQITAFLTTLTPAQTRSEPLSLPDFDEALSNLGDVEVLSQDPPSIPEQARAKYVAAVLSRLLVDAEQREQLTAILGFRTDDEGNGFVDPDIGIQLLDLFTAEFIDHRQWDDLITRAAADGWVSADVASVPGYRLGKVKRVGDEYCTRLDDEFRSASVTLDDLEKVIDPRNWPGCSKCWNSVAFLTPDAQFLNPQKWTRMSETISPFTKEQVEDAGGAGVLTANLKFRKDELPGGDLVLNFDLDDLTTPNLVLVDNGYIWASRDGATGVRVRTSKEVRVQGMGATALAMWAYSLGWDRVGEALLLGCAANPPANPPFPWEPSPASDAVGNYMTKVPPPTIPVIAPAMRTEIIDNAVELLRGSIDDVSTTAGGLAQRWVDGTLTQSEIGSAAADLSNQLSARQTGFQDVAAELPPSPDTPAEPPGGTP